MNEELIFNKIEIKDIKPGETPEQVDKKSILIVAKGLTEKFVPLNVMNRDNWTFKGKESRFNHNLPENNIKDLVGHVHDAYMEDNVLNFIIEVWGYREDLKQLQDDIKNGKMSVSAGFKATKNEKGEIIEIYGREVSITPIPRCTAEDGCGIEASIVMNSNNLSEKNMPNEKELEKLEVLSKTLERENGDLREKNTELNEVITGLNEKFKEVNSQLSEKNKIIKSLSEENKQLKSEKEELSTLSIRTKIVDLLGITDEKARKEKLEKLSKRPVEILTEDLEDLSRAKKISEKTARSSGTVRPVVKDENNEGIEENALSKATPEELTASLYPDIKEKLIRQSRNAPQMPGFDVKEGDKIPMMEDYQ